MLGKVFFVALDGLAVAVLSTLLVAFCALGYYRPDWLPTAFLGGAVCLWGLVFFIGEFRTDLRQMREVEINIPGLPG